MRYSPLPSVTAVRTFSIRTSLDGFDGHAGKHGARRVPNNAGDG